jgi:hypothetical protein
VVDPLEQERVMDFDRTWTQFAVDAEVDHFGTKRLVDAHNKRVTALEAKLSKMGGAAIEAEKMFDAMAIEGIKDWLVPPYRQLYAEVHTDLREALKRDEGAIPW